MISLSFLKQQHDLVPSDASLSSHGSVFMGCRHTAHQPLGFLSPPITCHCVLLSVCVLCELPRPSSGVVCQENVCVQRLELAPATSSHAWQTGKGRKRNRSFKWQAWIL